MHEVLSTHFLTKKTVETLNIGLNVWDFGNHEDMHLLKTIFETLSLPQNIQEQYFVLIWTFYNWSLQVNVYQNWKMCQRHWKNRRISEIILKQRK